MDNQDLARTGRNSLTQEIATRTTDPRFFSALTFLPNPDPVLRKLGRTQEVYEAIGMDSHVIGELRAIRGGMLTYEWRVQPGGDSPADRRAAELAEMVMQRPPAPGMRWSDVVWNMAHSVFRGYAVHEVVWERQDRLLMPARVIDRPQRRFVFSTDNELRLLTRSNPVDGIELGARKWLLTRHMHSFANPYGIALFSACFWPYTFKHSGFKYFVKFAEKYGIPKAIGKYPKGTPGDEQDQLAERLAEMVEDAVAAIPDDGSVELLETKHSGELVHERMVDACNRELSKALTSQTLATEIDDGGSRAAADTHREREQSVNASDRAIIEHTFDELFAWITELNVPDAQPPTFEFYEEAEARQEWVEVLDKARHYIDVPKQFAHERLQIPMPEPNDDVLPRPGRRRAPSQFGTPTPCPHCGEAHDFDGATDDPVDKLTDQALDHADELIESMVDEVRELMGRVNTLEELRDGLTKLYPDIDESALGEHTALAMMTGYLTGMDEGPDA